MGPTTRGKRLGLGAGTTEARQQQKQMHVVNAPAIMDTKTKINVGSMAVEDAAAPPAPLNQNGYAYTDESFWTERRHKPQEHRLLTRTNKQKQN